MGKSWRRLSDRPGGLSDRYGRWANNAVRVGFRVGKGVINSNSIGFVRLLSQRVGLELFQGDSRKLIDAHSEFNIGIIIMILNSLIILNENGSSVAILLICQAEFATILIEPDIEESVD